MAACWLFTAVQQEFLWGGQKKYGHFERKDQPVLRASREAGEGLREGRGWERMKIMCVDGEDGSEKDVG